MPGPGSPTTRRSTPSSAARSGPPCTLCPSGGGQSCNRLVELVTDYLELALEPADRAAFEDHLRICEGCSEHTKQIRTTVGLLGRLPSEALPSAEQDRLLAAFREGSRPT